MDEGAFWSSLVKELPRVGQYTRVENLVHPGMPDVNFCVKGIEGWMELKYSDRFPLEHPVLNTQALWIEQHRRAGGRAGICVGHKDLVFFVVTNAYGLELNTWNQGTFEAHSIVATRGRKQVTRAFGHWLKLLKRR